MNTTYIFYNPKAGHGEGRSLAEVLAEKYERAELIDVTVGCDYSAVLSSASEGDKIIISGGDGTLNRFLNAVSKLSTVADIYYYPSGTGNDFMREIAEREGISADSVVNINKYIKDLPTVEVNGETHCFINGVGYGIDGYCCEVGDDMRDRGEKNINYTGIAIKGLLFHYKPRNARITVDGREYNFKKVWLAPVMNGKYYGGGMIPTPDQDRCANGELSLLVFHGSGKLSTLMIFPSIFKGEHVKKTKNVTVLKGREISVEYDSPAPLQIDGETVMGVSGYRAHAGSKIKA